MDITQDLILYKYTIVKDEKIIAQWETDEYDKNIPICISQDFMENFFSIITFRKLTQ
jgi:hypothetical protein